MTNILEGQMKSESAIIGEDILFCFAKLLNKYATTSFNALKMETDTQISDLFPNIVKSKEQQMRFDNVILELNTYCLKMYEVKIPRFPRLNAHLMFEDLHDAWFYYYEEVANQLGFVIEEAQ